ncbi:MAG: oxidoreductase [Thermobacillus sp. ZCTH02-B1]|uniref:Gfo/Idh/MocA family protein n=1 Tax=Thermobacillus sp. ZCTH02-B1 TaxID=1858795 RepID=UPI000B57D79A|nr:Gfo/Idh/MocA family oxidoreductase [Thermobacillus sp. ZCTH02-B1]OUM95703.1 MAG: oxidoreductase [Thermobacillus sp. ZCTH02-B1]
MTGTVRVGVIGAGMIGNEHLRVFGQLEEAEVAGVADASPSAAESRAREHGVKAYASPEALLDDRSIDAVVIGVPNRYHAPLAIAAMERGKHVLLEKPMAINEEAARQILDTQKRTGRVLMMAHQMRWTGLARAAKAKIDAGELGRIYNAKTGWIRRKGIPGWGSWFTRMDEAGGGPLIDIGVHMLDLTLYLMGNPKPVSVYGATYAEFGPHRRGIGDWGTPDWNGYYDVEDLATALIKLDNGATLSLEVSWAANAAGLTDKPFVHLMGTEAGIGIIGDRGVIVRQSEAGVVEEALEPLDGEEDRVLLSRHFIECVREGKEPIAPALSGYVNNRILSAIYESSRTGREVQLSWD